MPREESVSLLGKFQSDVYNKARIKGGVAAAADRKRGCARERGRNFVFCSGCEMCCGT